MAVVVRRAVFEDARTIAELAKKLVVQHQNYNSRRFAQIATEEQMATFYGNQTKAKNAAVLVAELEGKVVGFTYLQFEEKDYAALLESAAWLHDIYVDKSARGYNAGKVLIEASIQAARKLGANKIMLLAAAQNENALAFFEHSGFKTTMVEMMLDLTEKKDND
jgi:GNAT superfamily N-acetyltransferase